MKNEKPTSNAGKKTFVKTVRLGETLNDKVAAYRAATGLTEAEAIRALIESGLVLQGAELYSTPLAKFLRELLQGQFDLLRDELEERNDELEERVAKVCSRGTKASLQSAVMMADTMCGLFPDMNDMGTEKVWRAYQRQAGELQAGASFRDARGGAGND